MAEFLGHQLTVGRLSPATVNQQLAGLRRYFAWAQAQGLIDHNPAQKVRRAKQQRPEPRALTRAEVLRLYRAAREGCRHAERGVAILSLLYGPGYGSASSLTWTWMTSRGHPPGGTGR